MHGGHGLNYAYTAERAGKVEQHDVKLHATFFPVAVEVSHRIFRIALYNRISKFPELFMLAVKGHFQGVVLPDTFHVTASHLGDAVLGGIAVHHGYIVSPLVMQDTGREYGEGDLAHSSFLAGECDK